MNMVKFSLMQWNKNHMHILYHVVTLRCLLYMYCMTTNLEIYFLDRFCNLQFLVAVCAEFTYCAMKVSH